MKSFIIKSLVILIFSSFTYGSVLFFQLEHESKIENIKKELIYNQKVKEYQTYGTCFEFDCTQYKYINLMKKEKKIEISRPFG